MTRLSLLAPGSTFQSPSLNGILRNGVLLYVTPCSSTVSIERKESGGWKRERVALANSMLVEQTGEINLKKDDSGLLHPDFSENVFKTEKEEFTTPVEKLIKKRKRHTLEIIFPKKFTVAELAEKLQVDKYVISNEMNRLEKNKLAKFTKVGEIEKEGKGRRTTIYQYDTI